MWLLASVVQRTRSTSFRVGIHVHVPVSCAKILQERAEQPLSVGTTLPACTQARPRYVRGCAEGMPTFADKSREQLKARASAAAAAGYNQLDDSDSPSQFALRTKSFALARKKVDAAEVIQRRYRSYVNMWRHYGPSAFVGRQPDQIANFGKCFFPCVLRLGRHHRTHP
jgi:hypothetical protein